MEIRLIAARRIGELVSVVPPEERYKGREPYLRTSEVLPYQRLSEFRKLAEIPPSEFKERIENLRVTKITLWTYLRNGKIKGRKMGTTWYVTEESLREYFNADRRIIRISTKQA